MSDITWTDCKVRLGDLKEWPDNPALISEKEAERLMESYDEFNQAHVFLIDPENVLIDGHQRKKVWVRKLGADALMDCRRASRMLTDQERRKMAIYLRSGAVGHYDWDIVSSWPSIELTSYGFDDALLKNWNNDANNLKEFLNSQKPESADAPPQTDRAEELLEKWGVQTGDLWQIGEHRLSCGDCTDPEVVARVMGGERAGAVVTDPPYAFGLGSTGENRNKSGGWFDAMNNASWFKDLLKQWKGISKDGIWWMFCNWRTLPIVMRAAYDADEGIESVLVWDKEWIGPGGSKGLRPSYELVALFCNGSAAIADRGQPDIYRAMWSSVKPTGHKAEKPIQLIEHLVSLAVGSVYDPFLGSGTTFVACQNLSRKGRGIEISPAYCSVTLERMSEAFPALEIKRIE